ncbi:MAG: hypothetical protein ACE5K4_01595 [Candidatus Hydrothermarchaeota archaeon]
MNEIKITKEEFQRWILDNYGDRFGKENVEIFVKEGLASLFMANSNLLISKILNEAKIPKDNINFRWYFSRCVKEIFATEEELIIRWEPRRADNDG